MDRNIFNNLIDKVYGLQNKLKTYNLFKNNHCRKGQNDISDIKIYFNDKNNNTLASFSLDPEISNDILTFLIEGTKTELESTAEVIKIMIMEDE